MYSGCVGDICLFGFSFRMYFFRHPFLVVADPEMIKEVLVKEFPKFHDRKVRLS